jgi:hypothetical protein
MAERGAALRTFRVRKEAPTMKNVNKPPGLLQDIGAVAGLYKTVFWMWGQRIQHGSEWERRLTEDAVRLRMDESGQPEERIPEHAHN